MANRFSFRPGAVARDYGSWPTLPQLAALPPFSGVLEKRRGSLMSFDRAKLAQRMQRYFDPEVEIAELRAGNIGRVAALLDPDAPVAAVTTGEIEVALRTIAAPSKRGGGAMNEADRRVGTRREG